jgi:uncharacterized low-complexity protein
MKLKSNRKTVAALAGSAFITTLGLAGFAQADGQPVFLANDLDGGYLLAAKADAEGKCGEGKCGASGESKDSAEGKCGEGKDAEGKCGESKDTEGKNSESKDAEGKCGEGKCGGAA